jgi:hypothetical protein
MVGMVLVVGSVLVLLEPRDGRPEAPDVSFERIEGEGRLVATDVNDPMPWQDLQLQMGESGDFWVSGMEGDVEAPPFVFMPFPYEGFVEEGASIRFCVYERTGPMDVSLRHVPSGQIMERWVAQEPPLCPA